VNGDRSNRVCPAEHAGWLSTSLRKLVNNPRRILNGLVSEGDTAVDLGCGPGFFSLPLAEMVGETGRVVAVDVQDEMLKMLHIRAEKAGLASRIELHHASPNTIGISASSDFALAFYVLHEVPDEDSFLHEVYDVLKEGGRFLLVEPIGHVSKAEFQKKLERVKQAGLMPIAKPNVPFGRAALFRKG
jgi:ubiquinone/menaquinone biosynthesis C-methylase UbiE